MSTAELACTYASLILHDDGQEITADKISAVLKAANVSVEAYWPNLFAKTLASKSLDSLITNVGAGGGAPAAAAAPSAGGAPAGGAAPAAESKKKEEKKEEEEEEGDFGMSLFD